MKFKECEYCGATLDFGEKCNCIENEIDRIYLNKLNINYFQNCITEAIKYYTGDYFDKKDVVKHLNKLYMHIAGLRDTFYIFTVNEIDLLKEPVLKELEKYKV